MICNQDRSMRAFFKFIYIIFPHFITAFFETEYNAIIPEDSV